LKERTVSRVRPPDEPRPRNKVYEGPPEVRMKVDDLRRRRQATGQEDQRYRPDVMKYDDYLRDREAAAATEMPKG
jgi:hypothetical protein